jgi:multidrug efflux system membrane fusion protein
MRDARITSLPVGTSSWRRAAWIALAVLLAIAAVWWLYQRAETRTATGRPGAGVPVAVATAPVTKGDIDIVFDALGTVTATATVTVQTQISGQLTQIAFREGQKVQKGDLLAVIDPRPYEAALEQAQGQQLKDQALLKQAQSDLVRYQTLQKQDSIAAQTVDDQAQLVQQYIGAAKTDQGVVDNAKLNIAYCHIVSPVTGRVGLRQVDQGNYVTPSEPNGIVVVNEVQPITVLFSLPEDDLPAIMKQLNAGATLQVTAFNRANTTKLATGKLLSVDNQIDTTTGTVKLRAQFDNADDSLFPSQFVNVVLLVNTEHDTTVIPTAALQRGAPGTFVYVVKPNNTVSVTPIKIGPTEGERLAVQSGLALGDQVVVDGADKLRDNAKVSVRDAAPKAGDAAVTTPATAAATSAQPAPPPAGNGQ